MADTKISALPASTTPLAGTEVLPIVQSSATKQVSVANLTAGRSFDALGMALTSTDAGAAAAPLLDLYRNSASPAASDTIGEIEFNGQDLAGNKQQYAVIHASILSPTSTAETGQIHFETATGGALTEKMIIGTTNLVINDIGAIYNVRIEGDTDANLFFTDATNDKVGIGTTSPGAKLQVTDTTSAAATALVRLIGQNNYQFNIQSVTSSDSTVGARINFNVNSGSGEISFSNSSVAFATFKSTGDISVSTGNLIIATAGKGIDFAATSGTGTSELFDDYEEGTFTPVVQGSSTAGTATYSAQNGRYTKIGEKVFFEVYVNYNSGTGTGNLRVGGLPFTSISAGVYGAVSIGEFANIALTALNVPAAECSAGGTYVEFYQNVVGGGAPTAIPYDAAGYMIFGGFFTTAA